MFPFTYSGGVYTKDTHKNEKFLLFFISGEKEIPFFQLYKNGIIQHPHEFADLQNSKQLQSIIDCSVPIMVPNHSYESPYPHLKLFVYQGGYQTITMMKSFYFKLDSDSPFTTTIKPFSVDKTGYQFQARGSFIDNEDVRKLFSPGAKALDWLDSVEQLPVETLRSIITVKKDKTNSRIRQIRKL